MYNNCLYLTFSSGMEENANVIFLSSGVRFKESMSWDAERDKDDECDGTNGVDLFSCRIMDSCGGVIKASVMPFRDNLSRRRANEKLEKFMDGK